MVLIFCVDCRVHTYCFEDCGFCACSVAGAGGVLPGLRAVGICAADRGLYKGLFVPGHGASINKIINKNITSDPLQLRLNDHSRAEFVPLYKAV